MATARLDDGRTLIITGSDEGVVRRWNAATGHPVGEPLTGHNKAVWAVASARLDDGQTLIITGGSEGVVQRWNAATGEPVGEPLTGHPGWVWTVASAQLDDGRTLIISGGDGMFGRWNAVTGELLTGYPRAVLAVTSTRLDDGRTLIITGGDDGLLWRWNEATGDPIGEPLTGHHGAVLAVATARLDDGRTLIISGGDDGVVQRWNAATGDPIGEPLTGRHPGRVRTVASARLDDGRTLIISSDGQVVQRWNAATGDPIGEPLTGHPGEVWAVATARLDDGRTLVISGDSDGVTQRWNAATGDPIGEPLTGHPGEVWAVATARLDDGRTLVISSDSDGVVRRGDAATGDPVGEPLTGHTRWVRAVASARLVDGRTLIITGDGQVVQRWNAATGDLIGEPLTGHTGWVRAVASARLVDGRTLIISSDGQVVQRWNAATGDLIGEPLTGHTGWVWTVASARLDDGRTLIITGDGQVVQRWNAATGDPIGEPLTGHTGEVRAVTSARLDDGRTLIISGGDDGVVRRWNAATGDPVGDRLTGNVGEVRAVASVRLDDGRTLLISGDSTGVLRRWNAATGDPIGEPLTGHTGPVRGLASTRLDDGRILIISGGGGWRLILWPLRANGQVAGEPILAPRVRASSVVDDDTSKDELNRGVLAAHLEALLVQLTTKQRTGTAVVHIDGKWGAGKSTLVNLLVGRLGFSHRSVEGPSQQRLTDPVVIHYDAWRESTVAPEWWSLARSINMAVRSQRALATRVAMTVTGAVTRTVRSRPVLVAGAVLLLMLVTWVSGAWNGDIGTVGKVLTTAAGLATLGLVLGQVLFWASPAFGQLHQRADDNPLGEVAATVASLRRWSPRGGGGHRVADTLFALVVSATVTAYLLAVLRDPIIRSGPLAELHWVGAHATGLGAATITALLVIGCWQQAPTWHPAAQSALPQQLTSPRSRIASRLVRVTLLTVTVVGAYVVFSPGLATWWLSRLRAFSPGLVTRWLSPLRTFSPELVTRWLSPLRMIQQYPGWWAMGAVLGSVALYARWLALRRRQPRRPILLIIDDLDRCSAERVVKLMETVHTLLREPAEARLLRSVRQPAPLIVLVLADGRWVRTAFETRYESFRTLGSPVHGLGADFLQKIFDHTVLVPALAANQVQTYVDHLTGISPWVRAGHAVAGHDTNLIPAQALPLPGRSVADANGQAQPPPGEVGKPPPITAVVAAPQPAPYSPEAAPVGSATQRAERLITDAAPGEVHSQWVRAALEGTTSKEWERLAEAIAAKAATTEALTVFSEDLLTRYSPLMPANPRLVKRVANTFGMLLALGLHLGHHEDEDTIARAAILFVRFPTLVDDLLYAPDPPVLDPPTDASPMNSVSPWLRRDVQQILRRDNGNLVDITQIARCYGRHYAPDPATLHHQVNAKEDEASSTCYKC